MDLIPTVDEHHLLVGLAEEQKVSPKKLMSKKAVEELGQESEKTESLSESEDVFDVDLFGVDYSAPLPRGHKKAKGTIVPKYWGHYHINVNNGKDWACIGQGEQNREVPDCLGWTDS